MISRWIHRVALTLTGQERDWFALAFYVLAFVVLVATVTWALS